MMPRISRRSGFTLLEVVLAMAMAAMLAVSMYSAAHVTMNARKSAMAGVEPTRAATIASDLVRADLESVLPPTGILAGPFTGTHQAGPTGDADTLQFYSIGADQAVATQQSQPLSEGIRRVELAIRTDVTPPVLVRRITRNLLPSSDANVEEEIICRDVRSLSLRYFDGSVWQEEWDSSANGDVLPAAVAITLEMNDPDRPPPLTSGRRISRMIALSCAKPSDSSLTGGVP